MSYNYKSLWGQICLRKSQSKNDHSHAVPLQSGMFSSLSLFCVAAALSLFGAANAFAQTTKIIDPAGDGGFNSGSTFAENGWTVANEGTGPIKWVVGTAVNSGAITGTSAYITTDEGLHNASAGIGLAKTVFFYRDVALPAGQTNIALSFNYRSGASQWQVYVAPTSVTPIGNDATLFLANAPFPNSAVLTGATPVVLGVANGTTVQKATGFIPAGFAGSTVRLIFMSSTTTGPTDPALSIDNISLVSRIGGQQLSSIATGNFSDPTTWDKGYVPSPTDNAIVQAGHTVTLDNKNMSVQNLYIAGGGATVQFGTDTDEFTVSNDLSISGTGAKFNVFSGTSGRSLKVGGNIDLFSEGRLDVSVGNTNAGFGQLVLFGSAPQTINAEAASNFGGTTVATTSSNSQGVINQLIVTNTSVSPTNITWNANNVRIKNTLQFNKTRFSLATNRIILGNYGAISTLVAPFGSGFKNGTVSRWYTTSATGTAIVPGTDHNPNTNGFYPILSSNNQNRSSYLISTAATGAVAGELDVTYTNSTTNTSGLNIVDGPYTVTDRYNGGWTVAAANGYVNTTGTFTFGTYASGAFEAKDGSLRLMNNSAVLPSGQHNNGTTTPFVSRKGITLADLTASPLYIGFNNTTVLGAVTKTSAANGDWNTAATWTPSGVPGDTDIVKIAHTVTNNGIAKAASITINAGATLINTNALTVGVTNNNAILANYGTLTVSGGTVNVNGALSHKSGSTFNQTGGNIIIDSNAGGVAANSVGIGGSSLKIENSSLNLTDGTITIVDPLINNAVAATADSGAAFTLNTGGAAGTFTRKTKVDLAADSSVVEMDGLNANKIIYGIGQAVSGTGIAAGTTVTSVNQAQQSNSNIVLGLSIPTTAAVTAGSSLTFGSMTNGSSTIAMESTGNASNVEVGQIITGTGIPAGTTVLAKAFDNTNPAMLGITLSKPVTTTISAPETFTFSAVSQNCATVILSAANTSIVVGQPVGGPGIAPGTTVSAISGTKLTLSAPTIAGITDPVSLSFYDSNSGSCAVAYNSPNHYAAGPNHTLQIGDGVSTDKAPVVTNGYLCDFAQGGGLLSLGKLTINTLLGTERFFNTLNRVNVQGDLTVNNGSVFKKSLSTNNLYLGGNVINNGKIYLHKDTQVRLMNVINGAEVATSNSQTISGTGDFYNDLSVPTGSVPTLTVNNTSEGGVTIAVPNFRVANTSSSAITMTAGIIHTSADNPLYHGTAILPATTYPNISGNFSNTCFIDGPYSKAFPTGSSNLVYVIYPVGKKTYTPMSLAITGGGDFKVEAFDTNTGTASANTANLSATRWKVTRNGVSGAFTDFKVALGGSATAANNIIVQAPEDQGAYDVLGTPVFTPAVRSTDPITNISNVNNISTTAAIPQAGFTGNFAYATAPNCTAVNPGNTIADLSTSVIVHTQAALRTGAGGIIAGNTTVTLSAAANALIVPGLSVRGTGIAPGSTVVSVSGSTMVLSLAPTASNGTTNTTLTFVSDKNPAKLLVPQNVNLSLQNNGDGNGVTYQWQSSSDGVNYTDIPAAYSATYNGYTDASRYYRCVVTCPNGPVSNNSNPVFVEFLKSTSVTAGTGCVGSPITLTSDSATATWFAEAKGGTPLATGVKFEPTPAATTTYYVSNDGAAYTAGRSFSGTSTCANNFTGLIFNTLADIRLNSVKVHPKQATGTTPEPITIKLFDGTGVEVPGSTRVFTPTASNAVSVTTFDIVPLNYEIPAGTGWKLLVTNGLSANNALGLFSNGGLAGAVPVGAGSIAITGVASSFTGLENSNYNNFFDLNITDVTPRVPVISTVINTPAPTALASQTFCNAGTVNDLTVTTGDQIKWYAAATQGTALATDQALISTTYHVSQTIDGCESATRTAVNAIVNVTPAPEAAASQAFCNAGKVADLAVTTGEHIKWYAAATQGTALTNDDALTSTTYHVSQTIDGCESATRTAVNVNVNVTPAPTGLAVQCACTTGTIADFVVSGDDDNAVFTWYDADGTVILPSTPQVLDTTYYVTQTIGGCEGAKLAVKSSGSLSTENFKIAELRYYPNPVTDQLTITAKDTISKVEVYNLLGQQLKVVDSNSNNTQIIFSNYAPSTYLVKVYSENNTQIFKVIKK